MHKILIVEDDESIREGIAQFLSENNYIVDQISDGALALASIKKSPPDLVILDLNLPKISGETVCKEIKKNFPQIFVIMLTAKKQSSEIISGFNAGADDYMSKPFELDELFVRVRARLHDEKNLFQIDDLILDLHQVKVRRGEKDIALSPHEFRLLHYLMTNKGRVLSREMILNRVWQYSYDVDSRVVDVYVGYLRKKIDADSTKKLISSVRGFGYVLKE